MRTSLWTRLIITGVAACTIAALAAPVSGQTLHRDGSKAVAFVGDVSKQPSTGAGHFSDAADDHPASGPVMHRDGSKAVPFVADLDGAPVSTSAGRFHWGDAAVGAAGAIGLMLLASAVWIAAHHRRAGALGRSSA